MSNKLSEGCACAKLAEQTQILLHITAGTKEASVLFSSSTLCFFTDLFVYVVLISKSFMEIAISQETVKKTEECEQEIEKLKQLLKDNLVEISHEDQAQAQKTPCPEVGFILFSLMCLPYPD